MVTQKTITEYGFEEIDDYFYYIIESRMNGQHKQARQLFADLSEQQQQDFFNFIEIFFVYEVYAPDISIDPVAEIKTYLKIN